MFVRTIKMTRQTVTDPFDPKFTSDQNDDRDTMETLKTKSTGFISETSTCSEDVLELTITQQWATEEDFLNFVKSISAKREALMLLKQAYRAEKNISRVETSVVV